MQQVRVAVALMIALAGAWPSLAEAQVQEETLSARNIRARKLAQHWQGEQIQLTLTDGRQLIGEFIGADFYSFTLARKQKQVVIPIEQVATVTLKPGLMEAGLTVMSGILGGALGAGIVSLTAPDSEMEIITLTSTCGAGLGIWWGYKTFFQEVIIELNE